MRISLLMLIFTIAYTSGESAGKNWWEGAVFYEVFVRSFYDSDADGIGDIKGLTEKLNYLNDGKPETKGDLGIDALWLMPIMPSPSYHGYDVTDYRNINPDYGNLPDFRRFLKEAHSRGIKVIIDFVPNHTSNKHPWFKKSLKANQNAQNAFRNFYIWQNDNEVGANWHKTPSGSYYGFFSPVMPDLNYKNRDVRKQIEKAGKFWIEDVGVDGFRLDAVKYLVENGENIQNTNGTLRVLKNLRKAWKGLSEDVFIIGEIWDNAEVIREYTIKDCVDMGFEFLFAWTLIEGIKDCRPDKIAQKLERACICYPDMRFAPFLSNHDQNRIFSQIGKDEAKMKLAAAVLLTSPGTPFLYYGEEIGMAGTKPDTEIRKPMQWSAGKNAGFSKAQPWQKPNENFRQFNVQSMEFQEQSLLNWYKKLIRLRSRNKALSRGDFTLLEAGCDSILAFQRSCKGEIIAVVHNFSEENADVDDLMIKAYETNTDLRLERLIGSRLDAKESSLTITGTAKPCSTEIFRITAD
ncbi:alpha-amylase family glycosyl hydrolase [Sedimentisphaera salicampi]|uniref:alpha-amylase family glycosyl hydrolase n=1 Tax=Sedimentisphaera salicampi TaxID=1941349 RepID=UPI000B9A9E41|nr:alpha-amylase family glycosyl hydrolase [Sedimentisphaera salicampi]OXU15880.1 Alpha-amylase precursor [Sedimentisphaera salicampi]